MTDSALAGMRQFFADSVSRYSEDQWAAGWLAGIEDEVRKEGGVWTLLAVLSDGWPRLSNRTFADAEGDTHHERWMTLMDWEPLTEQEIAEAAEFLRVLLRVNPALVRSLP